MNFRTMDFKERHFPNIAANHRKRLGVFIAIVVLLFFWKDIIRDSLDYGYTKAIYHRHQESLGPIANETLGFQTIFAMALRERQDRIIPLKDAAKAVNMTLTMFDGIKDEDIAKEHIPKGWDKKPHNPGELGVLRVHVMVWEKIIRDNISTALVLESDADWDLRIRDILANVARGVKKVADYPFTEHPRDFPTNKPYGDNWDLLWIGNCGSAYHGSGRFYAFNDSAVPPPDREFSVVEKPTSYQRLPGTRTVFEVSIASCTWGYAISNRGAVKLRKFLEEAERPIDCRLDRLCDDEPSLTCIGVYPQVISSAPSKSNIDHSLLGDSPPIEVDRTKEGHLPGPAVQYSARRNAHIIAQGLGRDSWISEF